MQTGTLTYRARGWLCLCTIIALTACSIGTQTQTADYQPQGQFSVSGEETLPDRWWLTFADPALDQLVETALSDNLSLLTAWDRLTRPAQWPAEPGPSSGHS
ncbi:MAG: hypothetical protein P8X54_11755 [Desulfuromonadales bacterium]